MAENKKIETVGRMIPEALFHEVGAYLQRCPYADVAHLMEEYSQLKPLGQLTKEK